ncbi:hypothetical protein FHX37_2866 [Haloactinospora alba]|uniref:ABC-2 type transport system permease protein n=1 Tax=Haloactinospora alba TaxID=405555 RepID=A0A543NM34_9ACTN|nr:hypothetical protein [Haloactinospora alba]TQN32879.1 hypothetical protein FHX37_2866 [Haloactinospora alba]
MRTRRTAPPAGRAAAHATAMSVRLWVRDSTRSMGISPRTLTLGAGAALLAATAGSVAIATALPRLGPESVPSPVLAQLRHTMAGLVWAVAGAATVLFQLVTPRRSHLADLLQLLPVPRVVTAVTGAVPPLVLALVLTATVTGPAVVLLADASGSPVVFVVLAALLLVTGLLPLLALVFAVVVLALQGMRVPQHHALTGAAVTGLAVALSPSLLELSRLDAGWLPHRALAGAAAGSVLGWVLLVVWCVGALAVFLAGAARLPEEPAARPSRFLTGFGVPGGQSAARAWFELVVLVRAPQYAAAVLFTSVAVVAFLGLWWVTRYEYLSLLVSVVFVPYFLACVQSYGHTRPTHWITTHLLARPLAWVVPKAAVTLALATLLTLPGVAAAAGTGLLPWEGAPAVVAQALPAWAAAMVAGVVVPYNAEQPLSVGLSIATASALYAATVWLGRQADVGGALTALAGGALLFGCYVAVARAVRTAPQHV